MKSQIVLIVVLYTVLAQCLVLAVRAYPTLNERLPALKEKLLADLYEFPLSDLELYNAESRIHALRAALSHLESAKSASAVIPSNAESSNLSTEVAQSENTKTKRGRQCLWKICSWSLEKTKKDPSY